MANGSNWRSSDGRKCKKDEDDDEEEGGGNGDDEDEEEEENSWRREKGKISASSLSTGRAGNMGQPLA